MEQGFWPSGTGGGGGGGVTSFNGQVGAIVYPAEIQVDCLDNATEQIVLGTNNQRYEVSYVLSLNVSGKKVIGKMQIAYDSAIIEDHLYSFQGSDISGLTISANENAGNIRIAVDLAAVGENSKFRYIIEPITPIV